MFDVTSTLKDTAIYFCELPYSCSFMSKFEMENVSQVMANYQNPNPSTPGRNATSVVVKTNKGLCKADSVVIDPK